MKYSLFINSFSEKSLQKVSYDHSLGYKLDPNGNFCYFCKTLIVDKNNFEKLQKKIKKQKNSRVPDMNKMYFAVLRSKKYLKNLIF